MNDTVCTDQTRKFSFKSLSRNNHVFITYYHNTNAMLVQPLKSRKGNKLMATLDQ